MPRAPGSSTITRPPTSRAQHPDLDARPKPRPPPQPKTPVASPSKPVASSSTSASGRTSKRSSDWWIERAARASAGDALLCQGRCKPDDWLDGYDCYYLGVANCADGHNVRPHARRC